MTNWEKYFGTPEAVCRTLDAICNSKATYCELCPFRRGDGCAIDEDWLESEADDDGDD